MKFLDQSNEPKATSKIESKAGTKHTHAQICRFTFSHTCPYQPTHLTLYLLLHTLTSANLLHYARTCRHSHTYIHIFIWTYTHQSLMLYLHLRTHAAHTVPPTITDLSQNGFYCLCLSKGSKNVFTWRTFILTCDLGWENGQWETRWARWRSKRDPWKASRKRLCSNIALFFH